MIQEEFGNFNSNWDKTEEEKHNQSIEKSSKNNRERKHDQTP